MTSNLEQRVREPGRHLQNFDFTATPPTAAPVKTGFDPINLEPPSPRGEPAVDPAPGKAFNVMKPEDLLRHFMDRFEVEFGYAYPLGGRSDPAKAVSVFSAFQNRYGREKAGQIVDWLFDRYKGREPTTGDPLSVTSFCWAAHRVTNIALNEMEATDHMANAELQGGGMLDARIAFEGLRR